MSTDIDNLTIDALKEISNIAAGHLSEVISQLTRKELSISVPSAEIVNISNILINAGATGAPLFVGYTNVFGDVVGSMLCLLSKEDAIKLAELTLDEEVAPLLFPSPLEKDALSELINITSGAYLSSVTQFLGTYLIPQSPVIDVFEAVKLLNFLEEKTESSEDYENRDIVGVSIKYAVDGEELSGDMLILVGPNLLDHLSKKIKEKHI